ncbi:hypothetical protein AAMO2058_001012700 [Amorphochlora amoebiformis]
MASSSASDALRPSRIIVPGVGNWSPGGLYSSYSSEYPVELENLLSEQEFKHCMNRINTAIIFRWPCMPCYGFSTVCCPFTCGLSTLLVRCLCFSEAEQAAMETIQDINGNVTFKGSNVEFHLVFRMCTSWIEIRRVEQKVAKVVEYEPIGR